MNTKIAKYIPTITMLPAILTGTIAMYINDVPNLIYIQNIVCFMVLELLYFSMLKSELRFQKIKPSVFIVISVVALMFSLISSGTEGVHRWVSVGPLRLYVSAIVLPIIIINLWNLLMDDKIITVIISIVCVSIILTLQPDASMMTAFGVCSLILLWNKINNFLRFIFAIFLGVLISGTWIFLDNLEPVSYVEGIFKLIMDIGTIGFVLYIISLALMISPFLMVRSNKNKIVSICFGIYFIIIWASNVIGNFPVPLMGYGISPIIGYFISIVWLTKTNIDFK